MQVSILYVRARARAVRCMHAAAGRDVDRASTIAWIITCAQVAWERVLAEGFGRLFSTDQRRSIDYNWPASPTAAASRRHSAAYIPGMA